MDQSCILKSKMVHLGYRVQAFEVNDTPHKSSDIGPNGIVFFVFFSSKFLIFIRYYLNKTKINNDTRGTNSNNLTFSRRI